LPTPLPSNTAYVGAPSKDGVARLFAESDVLVLPSMCEGFGRTLLEALAAGLAVITTERSGGPDILEAAPSAPLTIISADRRDTLAEVLADHAERRDCFIRPQDAVDAADQFSAEHYRSRLQDAISAAVKIAESRLQGQASG
jgi:glycosyltransferase involved in cell wall biosynthesis